MGIVTRLRRMIGLSQRGFTRRPAGRLLDVPSGYNIRELGNYETPTGPTQCHRYLRSGGTDTLREDDLSYLEDYGVTHVLDLRGDFESPRSTCRFARREGITWSNVPLFDYDISDPRLVAAVPNHDDYLVDSYLTMLANHAAICRIFRFFVAANAEGATCTLFHCAAGMDRTGVTALLLLGLAGVDRLTLICDYGYSFGDVDEVDAVARLYLREGKLDDAQGRLAGRLRTIDTVHSTILTSYGSIRDYLLACGLTADELDVVSASLVTG